MIHNGPAVEQVFVLVWAFVPCAMASQAKSPGQHARGSSFSLVCSSPIPLKLLYPPPPGLPGSGGHTTALVPGSRACPSGRWGEGGQGVRLPFGACVLLRRYKAIHPLEHVCSSCWGRGG